MSKATSDIDQWLRIWAGMCRSPGVNLGYPKQVSFYTPPAQWPDDPDNYEPIDYDYEQADKLTRLIPLVAIGEPLIFECLREYYGGYPSALQSRAERLAKIDLPKKKIYENVERGRYMLKGALTAA